MRLPFGFVLDDLLIAFFHLTIIITNKSQKIKHLLKYANRAIDFVS